jgi:hypothetical protein
MGMTGKVVVKERWSNAAMASLGTNAHFVEHLFYALG